MQSPTDSADRTGTIGVEAFDATYGRTTRPTPSSASSSKTTGRSWRSGRPTPDHPRRVAFVDDTLRTEARLNRTGTRRRRQHEPARLDQVTTGRAAIFTGGRPGCPTTATAGAGSRTRSTGPTSKREGPA